MKYYCTKAKFRHTTHFRHKLWHTKVVFFNILAKSSLELRCLISFLKGLRFLTNH